MSESVITGGGVIKQCTCEHKFQDEHYGPKIRVFCWKKGQKVCVCSVCGAKK